MLIMHSEMRGIIGRFLNHLIYPTHCQMYNINYMAHMPCGKSNLPEHPVHQLESTISIFTNPKTQSGF